MIVLVCLETLDCVLAWEAEAIELLEDILVQCAGRGNGDGIRGDGSLGELAIPRMLPDVVERHSTCWVSREHA